VGSAIAAAMVLPIPVQATAVTAIDEFVITRSGITSSLLGTYEGRQVFYETRSVTEPRHRRLAALQRLHGTYNVLGSYPPAPNCGGKLGMDSSLGGPFIQCDRRRPNSAALRIAHGRRSADSSRSEGDLSHVFRCLACST